MTSLYDIGIDRDLVMQKYHTTVKELHSGADYLSEKKAIEILNWLERIIGYRKGFIVTPGILVSTIMGAGLYTDTTRPGEEFEKARERVWSATKRINSYLYRYNLECGYIEAGRASVAGMELPSFFLKEYRNR